MAIMKLGLFMGLSHSVHALGKQRGISHNKRSWGNLHENHSVRLYDRFKHLVFGMHSASLQ